MIERTYYSTIAAAALVAFATAAPSYAQTPPAVLNPSDPALRLWLDSSSLVDAGLVEGSQVKSWVDKSSYGTIMSPRTTTNVNGPFIGDPVEENPHLRFVDINGNSVPTVRFDRRLPTSDLGDPNVDDSGAADRLYQTNNLAPGFDPLDIGDGSSLTTFTVVRPDWTTTLSATGGPIYNSWNVVFGKRGTSSAVYQFGYRNFANNPFWSFVQYDGPVAYSSLVPAPEKIWSVVSQVVTDNPGTVEVDTLDFYAASEQSPTQTMVELGTQRGTTTTPTGIENNLINNRNISTPEPFGIGGHSQACCGEGEAFAGSIAEIIIFAKLLTPAEHASVASYLSQKYFSSGTGGLAGDFDGDEDVDGDDLTVWKNQMGVTPVPGAPNADSEPDGDVDGADLLVWQRGFTFTIGGGASAIPEPATATLATCGLAMLFRRRRGRP
jgi:hypothetical protein